MTTLQKGILNDISVKLTSTGKDGRTGDKVKTEQWAEMTKEEGRNGEKGLHASYVSIPEKRP